MRYLDVQGLERIVVDMEAVIALKEYVFVIQVRSVLQMLSVSFQNRIDALKSSYENLKYEEIVLLCCLFSL